MHNCRIKVKQNKEEDEDPYGGSTDEETGDKEGIDCYNMSMDKLLCSNYSFWQFFYSPVMLKISPRLPIIKIKPNICHDSLA